MIPKVKIYVLYAHVLILVSQLKDLSVYRPETTYNCKILFKGKLQSVSLTTVFLKFNARRTTKLTTGSQSSWPRQLNHSGKGCTQRPSSHLDCQMFLVKHHMHCNFHLEIIKKKVVRVTGTVQWREVCEKIASKESLDINGPHISNRT